VPTNGGVANTNIIFHGGRLLALEEGHLPTEIEPGTLKTLATTNYDGRIAGPFTGASQNRSGHRRDDVLRL